MEAVRWIRGLTAPVALAMVVGIVPGRLPAMGAAEPPWQPPPCPWASPRETSRQGAAPLAVSGPAGATWFRVDAVLDMTGTLAGQRLALGLAGGRVRHLDLSAESFASGPVGGRVLVGDDDGASSTLRLVDAGRGCADRVAVESDVIRSGLLSPDGTTIWEHHVDRLSRADLGIWRRAAGGAVAIRILPGMAPDDRYGPTFATELRWTVDGRLAVAACGELACRTRVLDPLTGDVATVGATGPVIGVDGDLVIAYEVCHGSPCPILAVEVVTGQRSTLVEDAGPASLGAGERGFLVFDGGRGVLEALDLRGRNRHPVPHSAGLLPVHDGSLATSGMDMDAGGVLLASDGRVPDTAAALRVDPPLATDDDVEEIAR